MSESKNAPAAVEVRTQLLRRAGIAALLIVALLAALAWFERQSAPPAPPPADEGPLPMAEAPPPAEELPPGAPPMPRAEEVEQMVAAEAGEGAAPEGDAATPELTAAPQVVTPSTPSAAAPPPGVPRLELKGDEAERATPPAAAEAPPAPAPAGRYLVQLGVFGALDNAQALARKVDAIGIPANIESRVVVGPFATRAEADTARDKLRRAGLGKGLVVRSR